MNYANGEDAFLHFSANQGEKRLILHIIISFKCLNIFFDLIAVFLSIPATCLASQHSAILICSYIGHSLNCLLQTRLPLHSIGL